MRTRVRGRRSPERTTTWRPDDHLHDPDAGTVPVLSRPDADVHAHVELSGAPLTPRSLVATPERTLAASD